MHACLTPASRIISKSCIDDYRFTMYHWITIESVHDFPVDLFTIGMNWRTRWMKYENQHACFIALYCIINRTWGSH